MSTLSQKLRGVLNPNALINRTVWSSPQGTGDYKECCHRCKYWAAKYPNLEDDPTHKKYYGKVTDGKCGNLRIMAAYKNAPQMRSYYSCNFYEEKEKENGTC